MSEASTSASLPPRPGTQKLHNISKILRTTGTRNQQGGGKAPEPVATSFSSEPQKPEAKNKLWAGLNWAADAADKAVVSSLWGEPEAPNKGKKNRGANGGQVAGIKGSTPLGSPRDKVVSTLSNCFDITPEHKCVSIDLEHLPKSTAFAIEASGPRPAWQDRSPLENAPCSQASLLKKAASVVSVDPATRGEHQSSSSKLARQLQSAPDESERDTVPSKGSRNILRDLNEAAQIDQHTGLGSKCASNLGTKPKWTIDQMMNEMEEADASDTEPDSGASLDEEPAVTLSQVLELQAGDPDQHDDGKLEFLRQLLELQNLAEAPLDSIIDNDCKDAGTSAANMPLLTPRNTDADVPECDSIPVEMLDDSSDSPQKPNIIQVETRVAALPKTKCRKPDRSGKSTGLAMSSAQCFVIEEESKDAGEEVDEGTRGASISTALQALGTSTSPTKGGSRRDAPPVVKDENVVRDWRFFAKQKILEKQIYLL